MNEKPLDVEKKPEERKEINLLELLIEALRERKGEKRSKLVEAMA